MSFIEPFLEMLCVERGAAQNTLMAYKKDLEAFFEFIKKNYKFWISKNKSNYKLVHTHFFLICRQSKNDHKKVLLYLTKNINRI